MNAPKPEFPNLRIEQLPAKLVVPSLENNRPPDAPKLIFAFSGAIGIVAFLCGVLASIVILRQVTSSGETSERVLDSRFEEPPVAQTSSVKASPRISLAKSIAAPSSPQQRAVLVPPLDAEIPKSIEIPESHVSSTDFHEIEELELDDLFFEDSKAKKTANNESSKTRTSKEVENDKSVALAEKRRQEARRQQALARKIVKGATVVSRATPTYPRSARRKQIQGRVIVLVSIGSNGLVLRSSVSQSSGHSSLDNAAIQAAQKYRFKAAVNGIGQSVASSKRIPFDFRLR